MWYQNLTDGARVAEFFDCSEQTAQAIVAEAHKRYQRGSEGEPYSTAITEADSYTVLTRVREAIRGTGSSAFGGCDAHDLAQLFHDAWIDGIQRKDRVTLVLTNTDDRMVMVTVQDRFADIWADNDRSLEGSAWESDGPDFAYNIISDHQTLLSDLKAEGYKIDASAYEFTGALANDSA